MYIVFTPYTFYVLFTVYEYDYRVIMLPIPICSTLDLYLSFILIGFLYYFGIPSKLWRSVSKLIGIKQCIYLGSAHKFRIRQAFAPLIHELIVSSLSILYANVNKLLQVYL